MLAEVPAATRDGMFHLYHAPIFFWVEARDGEGRLLATTDLVELPPPPTIARRIIDGWLRGDLR